MKFIVCKNYDEMSKKAAEIMIDVVKNNPKATLGLATGSSPIGMYNCMAEAYRNGEVSFKECKSFNLDEYYKISKDNDQSYYYFMNENLFSKIDIDLKNTDIPNGEADDYEEECKRYDAKIEANGGIDVQVLGIGNNGHIGFNEPEEWLYAGTHKTGLTQSTIEANKRFFASIDDVPTSALTMGMATILKARKIVMVISGKAKAEVTKILKEGRISTSCPASILHCHNDVTIVCDEDAYNG
ncbi:MAG: glucosamine-6-phosphate deaminase [Ruminococcaceae bacterium]|nr:glucosamine-6-phosphate deaminase [Oscillospiraceae bacterium]